VGADFGESSVVSIHILNNDSESERAFACLLCVKEMERL